MENLKVKQILFIVIATIAIILILWNLNLNSKIIKIIPGPKILVNGECETDCECIEGRSCFHGRCTQIVPYDDPCQLLENCGLPFPPAQFGCIQEIWGEDLPSYDITASIGNNQITTIEEIDPSILTEISLLSFAGWQSYQPGTIITPSNFVISNGAYTVNQTVVADPETYIISNPTFNLCDFNMQLNAIPTNNATGSIGLTVGFSPGDETSLDADYVLITHNFNGDLRIFHRLGTNKGGNGNLNEVFFQTVDPFVITVTNNIYKLEYYNDALNFSFNNPVLYSFPWIGSNGYGVGLYCSQQSVIFNGGFRWSNISCSCTSNLDENSWIPLDNPPPVEGYIKDEDERIMVKNPNAVVTSTIENYQITVSTTGGQQAVRIKFLDLTDTLQFRFTCANYIEFRESISLNSRSGATRPTSFSSKLGKRYAIVANGAPIVGARRSRYRSDALFFTPNFPNGPWSRNGPTSQGGNSLNYAILIDGVQPAWVEPIVHNRDYRYIGLVSGTGNPFGVRFRDSNYGDNSGSYTVQIFELCAPL